MKSGKWDARANKMPIFYGRNSSTDCLKLRKRLRMRMRKRMRLRLRMRRSRVGVEVEVEQVWMWVLLLLHIRLRRHRQTVRRSDGQTVRRSVGLPDLLASCPHRQLRKWIASHRVRSNGHIQNTRHSV